jgi:hypothetical protein
VNPAHLDYDVLADLVEGLLDGDHAASASAHLDDCAECRARSAEIADVSRILADIPVPPMPADLAARIDEAIRAESMETAQLNSVTSLEHRRVRRHLRIFSVAAATVIAVGGGALLGAGMLSGSGPEDATGYRANSGPPADNPSGRAGSGTADPGAGAESAQQPQLKQQETYPSVASGTRYRAQELADQIPVVVRRAGGRMAALPAAVTGCVDRVRQGLKPVLVDSATYDGQPATVIVLPRGGAMWRVVVVSPDCAPLGEVSMPAKTP